MKNLNLADLIGTLGGSPARPSLRQEHEAIINDCQHIPLYNENIINTSLLMQWERYDRIQLGFNKNLPFWTVLNLKQENGERK